MTPHQLDLFEKEKEPRDWVSWIISGAFGILVVVLLLLFVLPAKADGIGTFELNKQYEFVNLAVCDHTEQVLAIASAHANDGQEAANATYAFYVGMPSDVYPNEPACGRINGFVTFTENMGTINVGGYELVIVRLTIGDHEYTTALNAVIRPDMGI